VPLLASLFGAMSRALSRLAPIRGPLWRTRAWAPYGDIFKPYATELEHPTHKERTRELLWDIAPGCILWLSPRDQIRNEVLLDSKTRNQPPEAFDRPILVLEVDVGGPTSGSVYFVSMSTFSAAGKYFFSALFPTSNV
jgi:hypothetical protein